MTKKREEIEKKFDALLSLVHTDEDKVKALKLMWEIVYPSSRPISIQHILLLDVVEEKLKKLGIRPYLPT